MTYRYIISEYEAAFADSFPYLQLVGACATASVTLAPSTPRLGNQISCCSLVSRVYDNVRMAKFFGILGF